MRYIKLENGTPKDYTIEQLLIDCPNANIYNNGIKMPNEKLLAQYDVYPLITESMPQLNEDETVEESTPEFKQGEWHQTWKTRKLSEEEIQEIIESRESFLDLANVDIAEETTGFLATKELQEQRYEICKGCDSLTVLKTCKECGCIMPLKTKLSSAVCPLDKW